MRRAILRGQLLGFRARTAMPSSSLAVATAALLSLCSRTQAFVGVPSASAAAAVARGQQSALSMAAKPDQLPAQAKRYYVRPDRILDVLTSAPQLLLRLGSGALVDGYRCEWWCWFSYVFSFVFRAVHLYLLYKDVRVQHATPWCKCCKVPTEYRPISCSCRL